MESTDNQLFDYNKSRLTEDAVKQRFVPFLKEFYRNRYEPVADTIEVNLDNVGAGSLVADIKMTFRRKDDTPFVCTCEATSRDKIGEVKYTLNLVYFLWDCAAFAALCTAVVYGFFYARHFKWLVDLQVTGNFGFIIGVSAIGFFSWYFSMQGWRKYRYIYAIEQFKRYSADEQWIALADNVFPAPNDPYMLELKSQCIYQGYGLALVPEEGPVRVLNAPSREGIFGKNRKMVEWVTRSQWYTSMSQNVSGITSFRPPDAIHVYWNHVKKPVQYLVLEPFKKYVWNVLSKPFGQTASAYNRFMSGQVVQKWVLVLSVAAMLPVAVQVMTFDKENMANLEKLKNPEEKTNPEDIPGYVLDGEAIPYDGKPTGVPKQYPISVKSPEPEIQTINMSGDEDVPTIDLSGGGDEEEAPIQKPVQAAKPVTKPKPAAQTAKDPCAMVSGKKGWVLQDNAFSSKENAAARISALKAKGITGVSTPRSCFESGTSGYIVWLGAVHTSVDAARAAAADLEKTLQRKGLRKGKLFLRQL